MHLLCTYRVTGKGSLLFTLTDKRCYLVRDRAGTAAQAAAFLSDMFFEYVLCDHCFGRHLELILYISPGTLQGKS